MKSKICGISDVSTLTYLVNHPNAPQYIGFIVNYSKSKRFVEYSKLRELLKVKKKNCKYVAVLVKPNNSILKKIKSLSFDYYQIYDCSPLEIKSIKKKIDIKIITALTISKKSDVKNYKNFIDITDIFLFDSKGYEKSLSFNHQLIQDLKLDKELMLAGNIQINDKLEKYNKIADIIDISGGLETLGLKDISKIDIFLNKIKEINDET